MKKTLVDIQLALQTQINQLRCMYRTVASEQFRAIFQQSSQEEQDFVCLLIEKGDRIALEGWLKSQEIKKLELDDLPIRVLRTLAQEIGVLNYSMMSKPYLVANIKARSDHARANSKDRSAL